VSDHSHAAGRLLAACAAAWLGVSAALVLPAAAQTSGGKGGDLSWHYPGGAGGAGYSGAAGGDGYTGVGVGGGGGAAGGGTGGKAGDGNVVGGAGGAGGTSSNPNGDPGNPGAPGSGGGGGGGGGGYNGNGAGVLTLTNAGSMAGGAGGDGGGAASGYDGGGGGGGGGGGYGAIVIGPGASVNSAAGVIAGGAGGAAGSGTSGTLLGGEGGAGGDGGVGALLTATGASLTNAGAIYGGAGGNGGDGGSGAFADGGGGSGGAGGAGVLFTATGATLTNTGAIYGGVGGVGGVGPGGTGANGAGGAGVYGSNLTIIDSGAIWGGGGANAITFASGVNTLQLQAGYSIVGNVVGTGADAFQLGGAGSGSFGLGGFGAGQQYQGFKTFDVVGGSWTLTGSNTTTDPFTVSNATAIVTGSLGASSMTVNAGGVLTGIGTVGPTQINSGGVFKPGSGVAGSSMTVAGDLNFKSGSVYAINLDPTTSSFANVTGAAALAGQVQADFASATYVAKQYTILTAAGGLGNTTFASLANINLPTGAMDSLSYGTDRVFLNLTPGFASYTGLSRNAHSVADGLTNAFNSAGGIPMQFFALGPTSLAPIDGEAATGARRAGLQLGDEFLGLLLDPFVAGRSLGATGPAANEGGAALGYAAESPSALPPELALAYASALGAAAPPPPVYRPWTVWAAPYGGGASAAGNAAVGSNAVAATTYGVAAGADYRIAPGATAGFALAGGGTNWRLANGFGGGRSDALQLGAYGVDWFGSAYVAGALSFANHWFATSRSALGDQLNADFVGQSYGGRLESGYRIAATSAFGVTPYVAAQLQAFSTPRYAERDPSGGGFGLVYGARNAGDARTELGARFDGQTRLLDRPTTLFGRVAWAHDFASDATLNAAFESLPGSGFTVNGAPTPRDAALVTAGAQLSLTPRLTLLAKFDGEFAAGSQTYAGAGEFRYAW